MFFFFFLKYSKEVRKEIGNVFYVYAYVHISNGITVNVDNVVVAMLAHTPIDAYTCDLGYTP